MARSKKMQIVHLYRPERRTADRFRTVIDGTASFAGCHHPCTIRNLSAGGAKLKIEAEPPAEFVLRIGPHGAPIWAFRQWVKDGYVGVKFERFASPESASAGVNLMQAD